MTLSLMTPAEIFEAALKAQKLTISSEFVPFSKSRNKAETYPSLNWKVTVKVGDKEVLTTDFQAGAAHCPSYTGNRELINRECESGKKVWESGTNEPILPNPLDVFQSLLLDYEVIDSGSFEDWAENFGYDVDSRKAEKIYNLCLQNALKLRNALGENTINMLKEACQDL